MKMKISQTDLKKIRPLRDQLNSELDAVLKSNRELNRLSNLQESITKEIADLEAAGDFENKKSVQSLVEKRIELEHITAKISQNPDDLSWQTKDLLNGLLREIDRAAEIALIPTEENYLKEIAKVIREFCQDENYAVGIVRKTPAAMSLAGVCHVRFGNIGFTVPNAQQAIRHCDEILSGELAWEFDNKLGK
jgi:hypothetical protein